MISDNDLADLARDLESDRVERTTSTNATDKFCEAICAFSNDFPNHRLPGYLMIGVDDRGKPSGIRVTDELLRNLAGMRSDGQIQPLPAITVQKRFLDGTEIGLVEAFPADLPPVRYKGRVHIRIGARKGTASEQEERMLSERRASRIRTFDAQPCPDCRLENMVLDLFALSYRPNAVAPEIIEENNRPIKEQLSALRFFDLGRDCATVAGALLFGNNPLDWLPGAFVQCLRFDGGSMTDDCTEQRFSGDLLTVLREIDMFIKTQFSARMTPVTTAREETRFDYPPLAIRELTMNAVMHRSYESTAPVMFRIFSNRIEIQNPGGLYGEATMDNFPSQTAYRNPVIAEAMKTLGYVNKYGRGVLRSWELLEKNGNEKAKYTFDPNYVLVAANKPV